MRIAVANVHFAPDSFGGATVVAEEMARGLRGRGHEVFIFTTTVDSRLDEHRLHRYERWGVPVTAIRVPDRPTPEQEYASAPVAEQFDRFLAAVRPDVVHLHALQTLGVGVAEVAQARGVPVVVTLHDAWWLCERQFMIRETGEYCGQQAIDDAVCATCVPDPAAHLQRQRRSLAILNRCAAVLTPSSFWRDLMVASGVRADVAHVNSNGVSRPSPGWQRSQHTGPARIGYIGGLSPVKGYPQLVAALRGIRRSDYELHVVDSYSNLGITTMSARDWEVPGLVRMIAGYTPDTIDQFFDGIDALVFPSQWKESYGLTVREAALRGVWPIMADGGGTAEHFVDGRNATVYSRSGGVAALEAALHDYLDEYTRFTPDPQVTELIPTHEQQVLELEGVLASVAVSVAEPPLEAAQSASG